MSSWLMAYLVNATWQVPLLFAAALLTVRLLRPFGPVAEHRVWVAALVLQVLLPAVCSVSRRWHWALAAFHAMGFADDAHVAVVMGAVKTVHDVPCPSALVSILVWTYGAVTSFLAARLFWQTLALSPLRRRAVPAELTGAFARYRDLYAERFGIGDPEIATSAEIGSPMTMGCFRKIVLLPANMLARISATDFETVIAHEFAHLYRQDFLKNLLYELLALPVRYHPVAWLTRARLAESREMLCDRMAAEITGRDQYTSSLLRLAGLLVHGLPVKSFHAIGIFDAHSLEGRLMKLMERQQQISGIRRVTMTAACIVLGVGTCASALALRVGVQSATDGTTSHAPAVSQPVTIASAVMAGNKLTGPGPEYPKSAKKAKIQGKVVLQAVIDKDGRVKDAKAISGPEELQAPSLDAIRQWTYKPYTLNGEPVEVETTINVVFSLGR